MNCFQLLFHPVHSAWHIDKQITEHYFPAADLTPLFANCSEWSSCGWDIAVPTILKLDAESKSFLYTKRWIQRKIAVKCHPSQLCPTACCNREDAICSTMFFQYFALFMIHYQASEQLSIMSGHHCIVRYCPYVWSNIYRCCFFSIVAESSNGQQAALYTSLFTTNGSR